MGCFVDLAKLPGLKGNLPAAFKLSSRKIGALVALDEKQPGVGEGDVVPLEDVFSLVIQEDLGTGSVTLQFVDAESRNEAVAFLIRATEANEFE